jgi:hypothetical protein
MILVWYNAKSFQRHIEEMGRFRRSHAGLPDIVKSFHDMPALEDVIAPDNPGRAGAFATVRGRPAVVPIWEIVPPAGSRN